MLCLILLCTASGALRAEEAAIEKPAFCQLSFSARRQAAGIDKDLYSYWETVKYTNAYGVLEVPRIGADEREDAPRFKHNAAARKSRYGEPGTELAFQLLGLLDDQTRLPPDSYLWIPLDRRRAFFEEGTYLVPLLKIEEEVVAGGGSVRYTAAHN